MKGYFVYHSTFKIGKIIRADSGILRVRFLNDGLERLFDRDAFEEGELSRAYLPLGTRCRVAADDCAVTQVAVQIRGKLPAQYRVELHGSRLVRDVEETHLDPIEVPRDDPLALLASQQPDGYPLFRGRERLRLASAAQSRSVGGLDSLLAGRIDPLPHQAYVAGVVLQDARRRYLLADEVGLGKTIEAGIVIRDLLATQDGARILVLCPGALSQQWFCEMYGRFGRIFTLLDLHHAPMALRPEQRRTVVAPFSAAAGPHSAWLAGSWDLVVVDEVHHLLATPTLYQFVQALSARTPALLLLSALPAQRRRDEYLRLLALLEPERYADTPPTDFEALYDAQPQLGRFLRRFRRRLDEGESTEELVSFAERLTEIPVVGQDAAILARLATLRTGPNRSRAEALLQEAADRGRINRRILRNRRSRLVELGHLRTAARHYDPLPYEPGQPELEAVAAIQDLVRRVFVSVRGEEFWSPFARLCAWSLCDPRAADDLLARLESAPPTPGVEIPPLAELGGASEWAGYRDAVLAAARATLGTVEVRAARNAIDGWRRSGTAAARTGRLADFLLARHCGDGGKFLVFAGYPGLAARLTGELRKQFGEAHVAEFRAEQTREEKEENVRRFRDEDQVWLLVSDESGGEGRNFQFADAVVHYDTPWSAARVEQRIGRLDRLGRDPSLPVTSHVVFSTGGPDADLVRVLAEGFEVYTRSVSGLEFALRDLEACVTLAILGPDRQSVEEHLADLRPRVEEERTRDENEATLDEASFDRSAAERYRRAGDPAQTERELEIAFTQYLQLVGTTGLATDWQDERYPGGGIWRLRADEFRHVNIEIPMAPTDTTNRPTWFGTFRRAPAQKWVNLDFFTTGHPLFDALMRSLRDQATGRTYAVEVRDASQSRWLGFEFIYAVGPDLNRLGGNPGLAHRAALLLRTQWTTSFVPMAGQPRPDPDRLLKLRLAIDLNQKERLWTNLTKQKVHALDAANGGGDWGRAVLEAEKSARIAAQRDFASRVGEAIRVEAERLREAAAHSPPESEEQRELLTLREAISNWQVVLDAVGFLSVNGGLMGRRR